jgi:hypothetical protein
LFLWQGGSEVVGSHGEAVGRLVKMEGSAGAVEEGGFDRGLGQGRDDQGRACKEKARGTRKVFVARRVG